MNLNNSAPVNTSGQFKVEPSPEFRKQVPIVIFSIILFFIVYVLLVFLALVLGTAAVYGGVAIILASPGFLTIMLGLGIAGLGVMVFFFIIKFIFTVNRVDHSGSIEVTEKDQPKLFAAIRELTLLTETPLPKRIFISPEVNAAVFYDSSFWSMFLPIKKNLKIGLGLVNSLTAGEFKAVLAHEFGHFSQRSMKLGSFVYNVNRVIFNMLYENSGYGRTLEKWASISGYFAFFASLTVKIVNGIQWILQKMYALINKSYLGLSREMEFHADAVAASVSGSNQCISALRRLELADASYSRILDECNELLKQNLQATNVYPHQQEMLASFATDYNLEMRSGFPIVSDQFLESRKLSRIKYQDQWASHPTLEERERKLQKLNFRGENLDESAWTYFQNIEQLQKQVSDRLYCNVPNPADFSAVSKDELTARLKESNHKYKMPAVYGTLFDGRQINLVKKDEVLRKYAELEADELLAEVLNEEDANLPARIAGLQSDIEILKAIAASQIKVKSFDFNGIKHDRTQAAVLLKQFEKELAEMNDALLILDEKFVAYLYKVSVEDECMLSRRTVDEYFSLRRTADLFYQQAGDLLNTMQLFYDGGLSIVDAIAQVDVLKNTHQWNFKRLLERLLETKVITDADLIERSNQFLQSSYEYFSGNSFFDNELNELHNLVTESWTVMNEEVFIRFRTMLETAALANNQVQDEACPSVL